MTKFRTSCELCRERRKGCDRPQNPHGPCSLCIRKGVPCVIVRPTTNSTTPTSASQIPPQQQGQVSSKASSSLPVTHFSAGSPNTLVSPPSFSLSPYTSYSNNNNNDGSNQYTPMPYQQQVATPFGFQGTVPASSFSSVTPSSSVFSNSFTFSPIFAGGDSAQHQHHILQPLTEPRDGGMHGCLAGDRDEWRKIPMQFSKIAKDGGRGGR